jgi:uncharacterized membrane protein (DUF485 family)
MSILHHASPPPPAEPAELLSRNARYGLALFAVYLALYSAFVLVNAFAPQWMEITIAGVNLAVWCGFGLIAAALVVALFYGWLCRDSANMPAATPVKEPRP